MVSLLTDFYALSLLHFPPLLFWPYRIVHSRIFSRPVCFCEPRHRPDNWPHTRTSQSSQRQTTTHASVRQSYWNFCWWISEQRRRAYKQDNTIEHVTHVACQSARSALRRLDRRLSPYQQPHQITAIKSSGGATDRLQHRDLETSGETVPAHIAKYSQILCLF